jgi:hypothetical protein
MAPKRQLNLDEVQRQYFGATNRLTTELAAFVSKTYKDLGSWTDADVDRFLAQVLPVVGAGQRQMSTLARAFHKLVAEAEGKTFTATKVPNAEITTQGVRGVAANEVYKRGFLTTRWELSKGKALDQAVKMGADRVYNITRTDLQLAKRQTGLFVRNGNSNIVGYARVLSGFENCALCYVASTQRYHKRDLLPIHPGCDCGEMPIYGNQDPGQVINENLLESTHEAVADRFGRAARDGREIDYRQITIKQHGELGPVLTVKGQDFTGPNDF